MRSNAKCLGVVIAGVLALCVAMAPTALAAPEFTGTETGSTPTHVHTTVLGTLDGIVEFTAGGGFGAISCTSSFYEGTMPTGTATHLTMTLTFEGCKDTFGRTVDAAANGCTYTLRIVNKIAVDEYGAAADIVACSAGKKIEFAVTNGGGVVICTAAVGEQTGMAPSTLTDKTTLGLPTDITVDLAANNVKSTTSGGFFNCGVSNGEHTGGAMVARYTLRGYKPPVDPSSIVDLEVSG